MKEPHISVVRVDWDAAAAGLAAPPASTTDAFSKLNKSVDAGFPGIAKSSVPVLLPFDVEGFTKDRAANPDISSDKAMENADRFMRSGFRATKFFVTGPAGYDSAFALTVADVPDLSDIRYAHPGYALFSGFGITYQLHGPTRPQGE